MRYEIYKYSVSTGKFKSATTQTSYFIKPPDLKYTSENVVYLFTRKTCFKKYTGSTENFWQSSISIDVPTETFLERKNVKQESFNACFADINGEDYWVVRLIQQTNNVESLRKKRIFLATWDGYFSAKLTEWAWSGSFSYLTLASFF